MNGRRARRHRQVRRQRHRRAAWCNLSAEVFWNRARTELRAAIEAQRCNPSFEDITEVEREWIRDLIRNAQRDDELRERARPWN